MFILENYLKAMVSTNGSLTSCCDQDTRSYPKISLHKKKGDRNAHSVLSTKEIATAKKVALNANKLDGLKHAIR